MAHTVSLFSSSRRKTLITIIRRWSFPLPAEGDMKRYRGAILLTDHFRSSTVLQLVFAHETRWIENIWALQDDSE